MSWMSMMPPASLELLDVDGVVFPVRADELHEGDAVEGRFRRRPRVSEPNDEPVLVAADVEDDLVFHEVCRPVPLLHPGGALIARRLHLLDPRHERGLCVVVLRPELLEPGLRDDPHAGARSNQDSHSQDGSKALPNRERRGGGEGRGRVPMDVPRRVAFGPPVCDGSPMSVAGLGKLATAVSILGLVACSGGTTGSSSSGDSGTGFVVAGTVGDSLTEAPLAGVSLCVLPSSSTSTCTTSSLYGVFTLTGLAATGSGFSASLANYV